MLLAAGWILHITILHIVPPSVDCIAQVADIAHVSAASVPTIMALSAWIPTTTIPIPVSQAPNSLACS
jgi:hypothetical protein